VLDLSRLSPEQRRAVLAGDGPLLIVAGPGSGKTTVLAARIAYLVVARQIAPASVLAIAFTTRATRELRARLGGLLGRPGLAVEVTTFHAFGLRIVRQWGEALGLGPGPLAVYGEEEAREALRRVADAPGVDLGAERVAGLAAELERHRLRAGDPQVPVPERVRALTEAYEGLLRRRGAVDYPAMLALPLRLFSERPDALRLYQDAYRYLLVDEFQDVCAVQYTLVRRLAERHRNLVVVGDPRQTLYGWRGADVRFLLDFRRDFPEARVVRLDQNFRSTGRIVDLANALGAGLAYGRPLWTDNPRGEPALLYVGPDEPAEADFVAAEIERLLGARLVDHAGEVAVLYRTKRQAQEVALSLRRRRLPYRVRVGGDLFARRAVRDAVAYLRLAQSPADAAALARIVNVPPRRLGRLVDPLRSRPVPVHELPVLATRYGPAAARNAGELAALVADLHAMSAELAPAPLLDLALDRSGYRGWVAGRADGAAQLAHLEALRALAEQAEGDLGAWLADLQLGEGGEPDPDRERVVLTTIHGAKGGEWRVVFVIGVEEGLLPHRRALGRWPEQPAGVEEELRVAYVAVTRPRERLYLTCCRTRRRGARSEPRFMSRFLRRLPLGRVERAD
jgi:DNA helicase-2/ATP-dependent DNA helicase PcrA